MAEEQKQSVAQLKREIKELMEINKLLEEQLMEQADTQVDADELARLRSENGDLRKQVHD